MFGIQDNLYYLSCRAFTPENHSDMLGMSNIYKYKTGYTYTNISHGYSIQHTSRARLYNIIYKWCGSEIQRENSERQIQIQTIKEGNQKRPQGVFVPHAGKSFGSVQNIPNHSKMVERVKLIIQKRTAFKSQLTIISNLVEKDNIDLGTINLRVKRLSELYKTLEDLTDELMILDANEDHTVEFQTIQDRYFDVVNKAEKLQGGRDNTSTASTSNTSQRDSGVISENSNQLPKVKLPKISLQSFDGKYENWLSFKNMFINVIDVRPDLTDLDKFHYLKSVVVGEAAKKLEVFSVHADNYKRAWDLLIRSYEVKRVLVSQHISMIFELPILSKVSSIGLAKLADDMQQHIASLNSLGVIFSPEIAIHLIENKLPKESLMEWESTLSRDEMPCLDKLYEFLYKAAVCASRQERIRPPENSSIVNPSPTKKKRHNFTNKGFMLTATNECLVCHKNAHPLFKCETFKQLTIPKRIEAVKMAKVCYNCLRSHRGKPCRSSGCVICQKRHNTLIHFTHEIQETKQENERERIATLYPIAPQLLTTAVLHVKNYKGILIKCRALLDTGATTNFVSETLIQKLNLPITTNSMIIGTINNQRTHTKGITKITIQSIHECFQREITCLVLPLIADLVPANVFPRDHINIPPNLKLADPEFHRPRTIDLIIGAGTTMSLFALGQIDLSVGKEDLYLQKTRLGWLVAGNISEQRDIGHVCNLMNLEKLMNQFWVVEELPDRKSRSAGDIFCENHYTMTTSRESDGRYTVRLPFKDNNNIIHDSRTIALKRLLLLERKFSKNKILQNEYTRIVDEYISLGHMSLTKVNKGSEYFMPHHAVIKQNSQTTKVRIVFDASAKVSGGKSLNDLLLTGPTIQEPLTTHLIRFRTYAYVITADIEKMYRQVRVHQDDRKYQRILWRHNDEIKSFDLNTLTFGVASSPFLAIRTLHRLADDERGSYPRAAEVIKTHMYVDDLLTGADSISELREIRDEIIALLKSGGFEIRQWASNDTNVIHDLASNENTAEFILKTETTSRTLGLTWRTIDDAICYNPSPISQNERFTKRMILSDIARIFDPLGLLGPIIFFAKRLMQDIWKSNIHWDQTIPPSIHFKWLNFVKQWESLGEITIKRNIIVSECTDFQLHGFCDASNSGYGACVYLRTQNKYGKVVCHLVSAKSRVAPIKPTTIPRLELCGSLLLAKLCHEITRSLGIKSISKTVLWSDSTIALCWIRTPPHLLQTYVSNRVASIQEMTSRHSWRHVRTDDNPADAISRGQLPDEFVKNKIWFSGPSWLLSDEKQWPNLRIEIKETPEIKRNVCFNVRMVDAEILSRYSSYTKLIRIIANCRRWLPSNKSTGAISPNELNMAEICILRLLQITCFKSDLHSLKSTTPYKGKLAGLNPFLDENDIIRVGGRLTQANLKFSQKHPILLPNKHPLTDCIIRESHLKHYHTSIQATLYNMRQKFWLIDGKNQIRRIIKGCMRCFRFRSNVTQYKMANLPSYRVNQTTPFTHTGIDYCGPFHIKEKKFRNRNKLKVYICVFVCLVIKAVHFEVVSDLTTEGFLAALRRFIARRGMPEHIHSDNGTNFIGANNQLKELYVLFNSDNHRNVIERFASDRRITWHFIPPLAPHFGGLWEATVKVFKHHFKRVIGEMLVTFEELNTFAIEVEGILNSRPIASLSSDPNDLQAITPAHYLIGRTFTTLPEGDLSSIPDNRLSTWQHLTKMRQDFWTRWRLEYLNELQVRNKWTKEESKVKLGSLALIKDKTLPCSQWALGRVHELHPGSDEVIRAVTLKTNSGMLKRSTKYICILPDL
ncbi:uncharacterized protein [Prorops nasuta]|uniref:uncharacterized protein n=1 Tax=Prorops nasuta TaxID=863751 RepID=UPI0034CE3746